MGKRERKIEVIKKYIHNISGNWDAYSYGDIPQKRMNGAASHYAGSGEMIGLIDTTIFGTGEKGVAFTDSAIFWDYGMIGSKGKVTYREISDSGKIPNGVFLSSFNKNALIDMISQLSNIEGESVLSTIQDINDGIDTFAQGVDGVKDILNKVVGIRERLFGETSDDSLKELDEDNGQ